MKRQRKIKGFLALATLLATIFCCSSPAPSATAANPTTMSFQGKVVNANGTNVTNGTYGFVFKLYTVSSAGSAIWTETQSSVTVTAGVFQVNLGSVCPFFTANACNNSTPIDFNANPALYLGITFNSDPAGEMTPRVQLQSVPFAYQADNASKLGGLAASNYVQLSPGSQQTGNINISGSGTLASGLTVTTGGATIGGTLSVTSSAAGSNAGLFQGAASATVPTLVLKAGVTPGAAADLLQFQSSSAVLGGVQNDGVLSLTGSTGTVQYQNAITALGDKIGLYASTTFGRYGFGIQANTLVANIGAASASFAVKVDPGSGQASSAALNVFAVSGGGVVTVGNTGLAGILQSASGQNLTVRSQGAGQLILDSANGTLGLGTNTTTIQRTAATGLSLDLNDGGLTTLTLKNSGAGVANLNLFDGSLQTGATPTTRLDNAGNLTNIGTIGAASGTFSVNAGGDVTDTGTAVAGITSTTNGGSGLGTSTSLILTSAAGFTNGYYVQVNDANCGGTGINPCYAKITGIAGNTLTITPALRWTTGKTVNEYRFSEIGGTETAQTLENRYGRGYFIAGVATGNGTTYYNENSIDSSLTNFDLLNTTVATLNIGGAATTINIGATGTTTNIAGALHLTTSGGIDAGTGALQGNSLSIHGGLFAVNNAGAITALTGIATTGGYVQSGTTANTFTGASTFSATGTALTVTNAASVGTLTVTTGGASITGNSTIAGTLSSLTGLTSSGTITFTGLNTAGVVHNTSGGVLSTGDVVLGTETSGNYVATLGTLTGLTTSGNTGEGSTPTLSVTYGSGANTAVQGNVSLTCASGSGNLTGGGTVITLGSGGTCGAISTNAAVSFGTSVTTPLVTSSAGLAVTGGTTLALRSTGANTVTLDTGGAAGITIAGANANNVTIGNVTSNPVIAFAGSGTFDTSTGAVSLNGNTTVTGTKTFNVSGGLTTLGAGLNVTGNIATTNGNILIQQAAAGASAIFDDTAGKIGSLKAGSAKIAFLFDNSGNFSIGSDTRTNIAASNTAGTDVITILGASGNVGIGDTSPLATLTVGSGDLFQVAGATGTVTTAGGYLQSGVVANVLSGATSLTATGTALSVTNAASVGTLVVTSTGASGITGSGALSISAGGTAQNITLNGSTTGQVQIGGTSTGDILLGGGSASTGCTVTNASGNFACTATVTAATINATTAYQSNGTPGTTVAACTAAQYIGNGVTLSNGLVTAGTCHADGLSDARLKQNVATINNALDSLDQLRPVSFQFNDLYHQVTGDPTDYGTQYGFIAQEVQQTLPGLVNTDIWGSNGYYGIDYHAFFGLLTAAVQQLDQKVDRVITSDPTGLLSGQQLTVLDSVGQTVAQIDNRGNASLNSVITPSLAASGALVINSGSSGDVTIDSGANSAAVNIGTAAAGEVNISRPGQITNVGGALVVDQGSSFGGGDVTMNFSGSQGLGVTSDLAGNVTGISFTGTPSTAEGSAVGVAIKQGNGTGTNGLDDALVIDNANTSLPIDSAIRINNSGGGGYNNLINTSNFSVNGAGALTAASVTSRGIFQMIDTNSHQVISFDTAGNANFAGNLNLASASLSGGLNVGGDANFAGLSTFQKLATFLGKTIFRQDVQFDGHITVASDGAGYASLRPGESTVHVDFANPYTAAPVVSAALTDGHFVSYTINAIKTDGFDIVLKDPAVENLTFSWTAIGVNNPRTATNPLPASP